MKNRQIILALVAAGLLGGGFGMYRLGMQHGGVQAAGPTSAASASDLQTGRKALYWHDPMAPGQKFDKPGKSPFMDMQLVPVYAEDGSDEGAVTISSRVRQNLGIRTADVSVGKLAQGIDAVGGVVFNERDVALIQARGNGYVERLHVRAPFDPVKRGQPLAELYVPDWVAAQEEFLVASRMRGQGWEGLADAARQRMRLAGMTDGQIRSVEAGDKVHARVTISAPVSGVVSELGIREGMTVTPGTPMFRLNGLDTVWVNAELPESVAAIVRPGQAVEVRASALSGTVIRGTVTAILPEVNPATRTLKARVELPNPGHRLVPGMFATVHFSPPARTGVLTVPTEAVIQTGKRSVVMLAESNGAFRPVEVEIGSEANGQTEIRKGLEAGQKVVVSGQFLIDSEASLRGTGTRIGERPADGKPEAAGGVHRGKGKVESIGKDEIMLSHEPIASLQWPEMTMGFRSPAEGLPKNLAVGDTVTFEFQKARDGAFEITSISSVGKGAKR